MKINATLDLDDLFSDTYDSDYGYVSCVDDIVKGELKNVIKSEVKKALKNDKELNKLITDIRERAVKNALKKLEQ